VLNLWLLVSHTYTLPPNVHSAILAIKRH